MEVLKLIKKLEKSKEFLAYRKDNKPENTFLAHAFIMLDENDNGEWQFGYFNDKNERMTSFFCGNKISASQETEVFKKPDTKISALNLGNVKFGFEEAKKTAEEILGKKHGGESPMKKIFILQNLDQQVWNITFFTKTYNIINIRINSETGKVVKDESMSILKFKAG